MSKDVEQIPKLIKKGCGLARRHESKTFLLRVIVPGALPQPTIEIRTKSLDRWGKVTKKEMKVWVMVFLEDIPQKQVAEMLGCSKQNVSKLYRKATKKMLG